jgi:hypothetical protein
VSGRVRNWRVLPLALLSLALAAVPASGSWRDVAVRESPRWAVATCLRATGVPGEVGLLGPLARHKPVRYELLRLDPGGITSSANAFLRRPYDCPAVAADPSGHAVVAGVASRRRKPTVEASLAEPGSDFAAPVTLSRPRGYVSGLVAAVSPRGDAVVAWVMHRGERPRVRQTTRVVAAIRPAGGSFGRLQYLTPWRSGGFTTDAHLAAGMDAAGTATVAWAQSIADRGRIPELSTVAVTTAPPGSPLGPTQTLTRSVQDTESITLAVAPNGAALLAHDGQGGIWSFERAPGGQRFERRKPLGSRRAEWQGPALALAPDGSAVLAWRTERSNSEIEPGVAMIEREGTGAFSKPRLIKATQGETDFATSFVIYAVTNGVSAPIDDDNTDLRVTLGVGNRYLISWGVNRSSPLGDHPLAPAIQSGVVGGGHGPVELLGCACRAVNGMAPLTLAGGEPALAYTDNTTYSAGFDLELALGGGRLHLAADRPLISEPAPPAVRAERPRPTTLQYGQALKVAARCDGPCDLRAYVLDGPGKARGVGTGLLRERGRTRVRITPDPGHHLAPAEGKSARVMIRAWAPGGRRYAQTSVPVVLRRAPLRELPRVIEAHAIRRDNTIVVRWRTDRPVRDDILEVVGRDGQRRRVLGAEAYRRGLGRRSFRAVLRSEPDFPSIDDVKWVAVSVIRSAPPHDKRTLRVPVTG